MATKDLLTEIDSIYFDHMPNFTMTDFAEEPQKLVAAATALRQRESLQAAIVLAEGKLGHLGISFEETMRSAKAQRDHLGDEAMHQIGFPTQRSAKGAPTAPDPAGPPPARPSAAALAAGAPVEVARTVNASGNISVAGMQLSVGYPHAGRRVTLRIEASHTTNRNTG